VGERGSGTLVLTFLLLAAAPGYAQVPAPPTQAPSPPPTPGFVSPYEIMRTLRAAGFDPLAPPMREGTTYVVRATDFRGILMRVVVDARTGAIRDANRIVPGPGTYGQVGMAPPPYGSPPDDMPPPYGPPPEFDAPATPTNEPSAMPPASPRPAVALSAMHSTVPTIPPLPRPRPAALASRKPAADAKPAAATDTKPDTKSDVTNTVPPVAPVAAPAKPSKASPFPPIND
jgi:hypothetical protein